MQSHPDITRAGLEGLTATQLTALVDRAISKYESKRIDPGAACLLVCAGLLLSVSELCLALETTTLLLEQRYLLLGKTLLCAPSHRTVAPWHKDVRHVPTSRYHSILLLCQTGSVPVVLSCAAHRVNSGGRGRAVHR